MINLSSITTPKKCENIIEIILKLFYQLTNA